MTFREPILENLTKAELIELIRHMALDPDKGDIAHIMWKTETAETKAEREEAMGILNDTHADFSAQAHKKRIYAHKKFDSALTRENQAAAYYLRSDTP